MMHHKPNVEDDLFIKPLLYSAPLCNNVPWEIKIKAYA